ncbi:MAG: type 2 isopentenyl-diphosphate Delta-isomerase, partial [Syntrophomonadaceae bacterium]|nr:type 2 isopentenyl-diphosphate Delta-isomerase [Syntrophomonadaceae bacterium]
MTGGTEQALDINRSLAFIAGKLGLIMAVGSQTIAVDIPDLQDSFKVVRQVNPSGLIVANVGAGADLSAALQAVAMINADALQLHFNVPQELAMPEGDRSFKGIIANVARIAERCPVPVIAKEVGFGFSRESAGKLFSAGVNIIDCGGKGGSNFVAIEDQRGGKFSCELDQWGIPTAVSLAENASMQFPIKIIASGGIRSAGDAAKALAMGADIVGMAGPLLKILVKQGSEALEQYLHEFFYRLKAVLLMTGSRNINELRKKPLLILGETAEYLRARGIEPKN